MLNRFKTHLPLILIILLGLALRLVAIFKVGNFTWDELFSFTFSQKNWGNSLHIWQLETNPPLHLFLLKIWWYIFPPNEFTARLPSLIFGALSIWITYLWAKAMFTRRIALLSALFVALSTIQLYASVLARVYAALFFLSALSLYLFYQIFIAERTEKKIIAGYIITQLFLLFSHLTAIELLMGQLFALIILCSTKNKFWQWIKLNFLPIAIWLIWIIPSLIIKFSNPNIGSAWFLNMTGGGAIANLAEIFLVFPWPWVNIIFLVLFSFLLIIHLAKLAGQRQNIPKSLIFILGYLAIPIAIAIPLNLWNFKFFVIAIPAATILLAYLMNQSSSWLSITLLTTYIILQAAGILTFIGTFPLVDWSTLNKPIANLYQPDIKQTFVVSYYVDKLAFDYYYRAPMPAVAFMPFDPSQFQEQILKNNYNYLGYKFTTSTVEQWYEKNGLAKQNEIFLLECNTTPMHLNNFFEANGWHLKNFFPVNIPARYRVYDYVRN